MDENDSSAAGAAGTELEENGLKLAIPAPHRGG